MKRLKCGPRRVPGRVLLRERERSRGKRKYYPNYGEGVDGRRPLRQYVFSPGKYFIEGESSLAVLSRPPSSPPPRNFFVLLNPFPSPDDFIRIKILELKLVRIITRNNSMERKIEISDPDTIIRDYAPSLVILFHFDA